LRLPQPATNRTEVKSVGLSNNSTDGIHTPGAKWTKHSPAQRGIKTGIQLLRINIQTEQQQNKSNDELFTHSHKKAQKAQTKQGPYVLFVLFCGSFIITTDDTSTRNRSLDHRS
jgi:hypothetical protein